MRLGGEQVLDEIVFLVLGSACFHAAQSFAATCLNAEFASWCALDVAAVREGDDHRVIGNEVLDGNFAFVR